MVYIDCMYGPCLVGILNVVRTGLQQHVLRPERPCWTLQQLWIHHARAQEAFGACPKGGFHCLSFLDPLSTYHETLLISVIVLTSHPPFSHRVSISCQSFPDGSLQNIGFELPAPDIASQCNSLMSFL